MNKKNVQRTFFATREQLQVLRTFFLTRVGSYPLGSRREMLRIMALVHLLPFLLSLTCFYLIMGNSTPLFFPDRFSSLLLLHEFCKTVKSRRQSNRMSVLPQLLGNTMILLFVHLKLLFFKNTFVFLLIRKSSPYFSYNTTEEGIKNP